MQRVQIFLLFSFMLIISCTNDQLPDVDPCEDMVTYNDQISGIINNSCAYSGCHVTGFSSGDYSSFDALQNSINSGQFENRVLGSMDMPPTYAPEGKPKSLTSEEIELIECWKANGFPE